MDRASCPMRVVDDCGRTSCLLMPLCQTGGHDRRAAVLGQRGRGLMWDAAATHGRPLHRLSLAGTIGHLNALEPFVHLYEGTGRAVRLHELLLRWIANDLLPERPNRVEPRAVKRRPKPYPHLNRPRPQARKALLR